MKKKDKKVKNKNEEVKMENYWDVFVRNYKSVPAFKSLVKLILCSLFIIMMILVVGLNQDKTKTSSNNRTTTTKVPDTTTAKVTYQSMLDEVIKGNKDVLINITSESGKYLIEAKLDNGIMEGFFQTNDKSSKFRIKDGKVYEVKIEEENLNPDLFLDLDLNAIDQVSLLESLKSLVATKEKDHENIIYNYNLEDDHLIKVTVQNEHLSKIDIIEGSNEYLITYS